MSYYKLSLSTATKNREILLAFMQTMPFDSFQETDYGLDAYINAENWSDSIQSELGDLKKRFNFSMNMETLEEKNWNAIWESNFEPIVVNEFCGIRADFHPPLANVHFELIINPKMAFGTGHHETTYMMIELMEGLDFRRSKVLDFGCGTGILAILASKMGVGQVTALDYDHLAVENTLENAQLNKITALVVKQGTINDITESGFDYILANINRSVILDSLQSLYSKLKPSGILLVSGVLVRDKKMLNDQCVETGFSPVKQKILNQWLCMAFQRI